MYAMYAENQDGNFYAQSGNKLVSLWLSFQCVEYNTVKPLI